MVSNLWATEAWTSYGLLTIAFLIYSTDLANYWLIALNGLIALTLQIIIVEFAFKTVTDRSDMALGKTYFASVWLVVILISTVITRKRFYRVAQEIDIEVAKKEMQEQRQLKRIRLMNLQDHLNLKLHGTVLNTLLVVKNHLTRTEDIADLVSELGTDLKEFEDSSKANRNFLKDRIIQSFKILPKRRTNITFRLYGLPDFLDFGEEQILEIVREVVNNIERHTQATEICVAMNVSVEEILRIAVSDNSPSLFSGENIESLIDSAERSLTLQRLVAALGGKWEVFHNKNSSELVHEISINLRESNEDFDSTIESMRGNSFDFISTNLIFTSGIYGVLIFPLLIFSHGMQLPIILYSVSLALFWAGNLANRFSSFLTIAASASGALVIPAFFWAQVGCSNLRSLPWIFNGLLGPVLAISTRKTEKLSLITKWLPISTIIVESLLTVQFLPSQCHQILQGSTPGLIAVGIAAFLLGRARKSARKRFLERRASSNNPGLDLEVTRQSLATERKNILKDLMVFQESLVSTKSERSLLEGDLQVHIDGIRAFLLCSEYFDSELVRALYGLTKMRILAGHRTKVAIITGSDRLRDLDQELASCLAIVFEYCTSGPMDIQVTAGGNQIDVAISVEQFKKIPFDSLTRLRQQGINAIAQ